MTPNELRAAYPVGTRLVLDAMDDVQAPPIGTAGTVRGVDDSGQLLMQWDTGSGLNLIPGVDSFHLMDG